MGVAELRPRQNLFVNFVSFCWKFLTDGLGSAPPLARSLLAVASVRGPGAGHSLPACVRASRGRTSPEKIVKHR
jgi:hypothetical protein